MRPELPTGTVTFLFTDIEGSTRLLHALGPESYAEALAEHRHVLRAAFAAHGGVEVDTQGDAFFVAFPTPGGAAAAAAAGTQALADGPIAVRMGLHTGTPTVAAEGYVGVDVHRGARVGALAHGGQIVVSPTTAALLDGEPLRDLGTHRLKDFDGATRLFQLGLEPFPALRTPGSVELPAPATRFLGRERELFEAVSLVYERDPRVLTVLGPGGTGKTRFALELCRLLAEDADGGTVFVALAPLREPDLVLATIAERLGASSPEMSSVAARIGDRRTHLLCDNIEQLLPAAARPLGELATAAPHLRLFVTSREPLRIQGEVELDLPPLDEAESTALFLERAHAVRPDLERTPAVSELCARLDHLPLALELAAARTKLLAPEALLERLEARLDLLRGTRDADERHSTLRATIAWSYDLLDPDEQQLFRRLAVFRGGCTLESAEKVCDADLDTLGSLLDKSLVRRRTGRLGEERFWMLETIREFAGELLEESQDVEALRRRHAELMHEIALSAHLTENDDERFRLPVVLADEPDMRAAVDWASEVDVALALELIVALENFWNIHAHREVIRRLRDLLPRALAAPPFLRANALRVLGGALHVDGQLDACDEPYRESLTLYRELDEERGTASLLQRLANSASQREEFDEARALLASSQELAEGRFPYIEIANVTVLGRVAIASGNPKEGREHLRRAVEMAHAVDWHWWEAGVHASLALAALNAGELDDAEERSLRALRLIREDRSRPGSILPLVILARVALARRDLRRAGLLWGAVDAEMTGSPILAWDRVRSDRAGGLLHETDSQFLAALEAGNALDLWDAVSIALGDESASGD